MASNGRLSGKVAVVSGAGSSGPGIGIGRAIAVVFARSGAQVALLDVNEEAASATAQMIREEGISPDSLMVVGADAADDTACARAVRQVMERWKRLDVLVNSAAVDGPVGTVTEVAPADWDHAIRVNINMVFMMARHVIPHMIRGGGGSIINISSIMGLRGGTRKLAYATAKGGLINMTQTMAYMHGADSIRVNCIVPGHVYTPMALRGGLDDEGREARRLRTLLKSEGTPWDVAFAAVFLASDEARWITGIALPVDGGYLAAEPRI